MSEVRTEPIRVLQLFAGLGRAGAETMIMNYYRRIDKSKIQFDFVVRTKERLDYEDEIESLGGVVYHIASFKINGYYYIKQIRSIFDKTDYTIIHANVIESAFFILKEAHRRNVKVIIAHSHTTHSRNKIYEFLKSIIFHFQKNIITDYFACGYSAALNRFGKIITNRTIILPNAIDVNQFKYSKLVRDKVRDCFNWNENFVLINVARFIAPKNHLFILDIFLEIIKIEPSSLLVLVGGFGNLEEQVRKKVAFLKLEENVQFLGGRDDVYQLLQGADIFLLPSLYEGLPVSLIEAQTSGLKIVASTGVPKEVAIIEGLIDFLSLDENARYWAEHILHSARYYERVDRHNEVVAAGFDIVKNAEWLQNYYLEKARR